MRVVVPAELPMTIEMNASGGFDDDEVTIVGDDAQ